jgi:general nucleoside transport system permease protein
VIVVERRPSVPMVLAIAAPIVAALVALIVTISILVLIGAPASSLGLLTLSAAFGSTAGIGEVVGLSAPLMLTGLAATLAFRVGLINLGIEGQIIAAALVASLATSGILPLPSLAMIPIALLASLIVGAGCVATVAGLRMRLRVDEAVLTLLVNLVMLFSLQLMAGTTRASLPPIGTMQPLPIANAIDFPSWAQALHRYLEPLLALIACVLATALMRYTIWGLDIRAAGGNPVAARFAGIHVGLIKLNVALLSGTFVGLAAVGQIFDAPGGTIPSITLGLGYAGLAVALLAALEPVAVVPAAVFVSVMLTGIKATRESLALPLAVSNVFIALLLITALIANSAVRYRLRLRGSAVE